MSTIRKPGRWIRRNLFASAVDAALTLVFVPLCLWAAGGLLAWAFTTAQWRAVTDNLRVFMVGTFPPDLVWRAWASVIVLAVLGGASVGLVARAGRRPPLYLVGALLSVSAVGASAVMPALGWTLTSVAATLAGWSAVSVWPGLRKRVVFAWCLGLVGIGVLLAPAGAERCGGLLLSVLVTLLASILSVPLGVALAFGRCSRFASARILCTGYIEVMRSLPLILIVYCVWVVTPLLVRDIQMPDIARGLLGFVLFFAAYVAEYVRSGLQSVPRGQAEAALSLGMTLHQVNRDIVLPQAARVVMPALVGNVLDIFNTVPLLFIIGLTDFLRAGQMVLVNPQSRNPTYEIYIFMFAVYGAIASLITFGSRRLEARLACGHR